MAKKLGIPYSRPGFRGAKIVDSRLNAGGDTAFQGKRGKKGSSTASHEYGQPMKGKKK